MTDKSCPKRVRLVERLARAINKKKRVESKPSPPKPATIAAEQELQEAMEAVRTQSAEEICGAQGGDDEGKHAA